MTPDSDPKIPTGEPQVPRPVPGPVTRSKAPPGTAPPRTPSGRHPAVRAFRGKLASIQDSQCAALDDLTAQIEQATETISKTPVPPPLEEADEGESEDETTPIPTSH